MHTARTHTHTHTRTHARKHTHAYARMHAAHTHTNRYACRIYASIQAGQEEMGMRWGGGGGGALRLAAETKKFRSSVHRLRGIVWF